MQLNWYCLRTLPRKEQAASEALRGAGIETLAPRIHTFQRTVYRTNEIKAPLFPSYLFARLDLESHYASARKTQGVAYFVGFDGSPFVVPQMMIDEVIGRMDRQGFVTLDEATASPSGYVADEPVMITGGPFAGIAGLFRRDVDAGQRVVLFLKMLGREFEHPISLVDTRAAFVNELAFI